MLARLVFGAFAAAVIAAPAFAESMNAEEARKFVAGKLFAFTCFDGTRGMGRIYDDGSAQGAVQFSGTPQARAMRLPVNTLQVRGERICASIRGLPFDPCFNLEKNDAVSFRGSVSGLGFAYCDFRRQQGNGRVHLARSVSRPRSLRAPGEGATQSADASRVEARAASAARSEPVLELRRTTAE